LAIGYTLDEILNDITKKTPACFEPSIDYVVTKIPRWDFEKFPEVDDILGVQMKSVGEAMAFGRTFKESLQKAIRSLEQNRFGFGFDKEDYFDNSQLSEYTHEKLRASLRVRHSRSLFDLCDALRYGYSTNEIFELTKYDPWFIEQCREIVDAALSLRNQVHNGIDLFSISTEELRSYKQLGFSDVQLACIGNSTEDKVRQLRKNLGVIPVFKTVDTCAAEFESETPYHYSTYEEENESVRSDKKKVIILASGPNRIGQGIEFD